MNSRFVRILCVSAVLSTALIQWGCGKKSEEPAADTVRGRDPSERDAWPDPEDAPFPPAPAADVAGRPGAGAETGNAGPNGAGKKGGGRPGPQLSEAEKAALEMIQRVGGRIERIAGSPAGPGPYGLVTMPGDGATMEDLAVLTQLDTLYTLTLPGPAFGDTSVGTLLQMPKLSSIHLVGPTFTDSALLTLAPHPVLRVLILEELALGKDGLAALAASDSLQFVDLVRIEITPEILDGLSHLRRVGEIRFVECEVSDEDLARLGEALPDCSLIVQ